MVFKIKERPMARILIADDDLMMRELLSALLVSTGHEVTAVVNGYEALRLFSEKPFDLVTTDCNMPVMDGSILAKRIKQKSPLTPVIMITGEAINAEYRQNKCKHVDLIVSKPFTRKAINQAVTGLMGSPSSGQKVEMHKANRELEKNYLPPVLEKQDGVGMQQFQTGRRQL
ncbi:MAG: response regulator [Desulfobacteraceae bacterium]|nr:MAG: response regulator [Desulfobacteraceae bacterium]